MGGQIADATVVAAPPQRDNDEEKANIKAGNILQDWQDKPVKLAQKDRDARSTVKCTTARVIANVKPQERDITIFTFGNKNHVTTNKHHGFFGN